METRARYATIGLFTLLVILLAFGFIYWLKRLDETGLRAPVQFVFEGTVNGLAPGGSVYFAGIKVGNVLSLSFDPANPGKVLVNAEIRSDTPVKADTTAQVASNLLTGIAYVELLGGSPGAPSIFSVNPPLIVGTRSNISDIVAAANATVSRVDAIVVRLDRLLETSENSIKSTVDNVTAFTSALAENADGVKDFLANVSEMATTIGSISQRLEGLIDNANQVVGAIDPAMVRSTLASADKFMKEISAASTDIDSVVADVRKAVDQISTFSDGLNKTLAEVQKVVDGISPEKVAGAVDSVTGFADRLKAAGPDIDQVIADAKATAANASEFSASLGAQKDNVNQIIADAKKLAESLNASSAKLDAVLGKADSFLAGAEGEGTRNFFQEASAAAKSIKTAADTLSRQANEVGAGLSKFSSRGLDGIIQLVNDLRATVARIDRTVADFSRNPAGAVFGGNSGVREYNRR